MERGLYIAASGMLAEQVRQNQIANDLANASTPGYKADRSSQQAFADMLLQNSASGQTIGPLGLGVTIAQTTTDLTGAPVRDTGEPLDFAIEGDGFFQVQTPQGNRFTRDGQFMRAANGTLTDALGNPVLNQRGGTIQVQADGTVAAGSVGVFNLTNAQKQGDSLFTGTANGTANGTVRSGALEGSGTDPARSMVDMITSYRAYEAGQKVIRTIDETLNKAVTQVPSISG
jgi:flagellar basal-body rod protein FlgF